MPLKIAPASLAFNGFSAPWKPEQRDTAPIETHRPIDSAGPPGLRFEHDPNRTTRDARGRRTTAMARQHDDPDAGSDQDDPKCGCRDRRRALAVEHFRATGERTRYAISLARPVGCTCPGSNEHLREHRAPEAASYEADHRDRHSTASGLGSILASDWADRSFCRTADRIRPSRSHNNCPRILEPQNR